jgi:hypothetical protein
MQPELVKFVRAVGIDEEIDALDVRVSMIRLDSNVLAINDAVVAVGVGTFEGTAISSGICSTVTASR